MPEQKIDNKLIAKNTIFMYIRMFITIVVGLYVSRVVLRTLGVVDYGVYNVIGGVIVILTFISNSLRNATQRFMSIEIGRQNKEQIHKVFNVSIECHLFISLIVLLLAETIGLWFVYTQLNIPSDRLVAAKWVYQFSVLTFIIHLLQVPYNATIISYERMSFYAYVSILEALLKLGVAFLLVISPWDKLIVYSILLTVVALICLAFYMLYCSIKLKTGVFSYVKDKKLFKQILSFSSWSMIGGGANVVAQQGGNILLNFFKGVTVNAAFGIASQVTGMVYSFVSNFQYAFQPQITKLYAIGDKDNLQKLMYRASSFSYYLMMLIFIPFVLEADYVLELWLGKGQVPEYSVIFCQLMLAYFLCDAIQAPLWMLVNATGKIKCYTTWTAILVLLNIPLAWLCLKRNLPVYWVFIVRFGLNFIGAVIRTFYVPLVADFSSKQYISKVVFRALAVTVLAFGFSYYVKYQAFVNVHPLGVVLISILITIIVVALIGFNKQDRTAIYNMFINKMLPKK